MLNRVEDTVGNAMSYHYDVDAVAETRRIDRIEYTENLAAGVTAQSRVQFAYEDRPDRRSQYLGGARLNVTQRLSAVQTFTNGGLVREYLLAYDQSPTTNRSRLRSVTECAANGDCLTPMRFDWTEIDQTTEAWRSSDEYIPPYYIGLDKEFDSGSRVLDLNGDGLVDFVYRRQKSGNGGEDSGAFLNTGNGWASAPDFVAPIAIAKDGGDGIEPRFVDLNGDGREDFVYKKIARSGALTEGAYLNTGSGWVSTPEYILPYQLADHKAQNSGVIFADLDQDGLVDLLYRREKAASVIEEGAFLNTGNGWVEAPAYTPPYLTAKDTVRDIGSRILDVNGDGLPDFIYNRQLNYLQPESEKGAYLNTGNGWVEAPEYVPPYYLSVDNGPSGAYLGPNDVGSHLFDVNGDGLVDFFFANVETRESSSWVSKKSVKGAYLNSGAGWVEALEFTPPIFLHDLDIGTRKRFYYADLNGDNLTEILYHRANAALPSLAAVTWIGTGEGWKSKRDDADYPLAYSYLTAVFLHGLIYPRALGIDDEFVDVNGDGLTDHLQKMLRTDTPSTENAFINNSLPDLMISVTDSLGYTTRIDYAPLTDKSVHLVGTDAAFPVQDFADPNYVVSAISGSDGAGGVTRSTYRYEGARQHVQGRGFLGYARMIVADETTGVETITDYRQDFPFIGQVAATEQRLSDGTLIKRVTDTWEEKALNGGLTTFPFVAQSQAKAFEINDGPGNLPITTITTTNDYDDFGNATSIVATTSGGGETFKKTTTNQYANDTVNWFLGRLIRATVKSELPDLTFETRVSAFDYDPLTGLLKQEVIEPDRPAFRLTTEYGHDAFGNITSKTISGADITTRTTTTEHSVDGRFAVKVTNDLGHAETRAHDARFGTVTRLTGPNLITTTWEFDGFGRRTREARADGTETTWSYELCATQCPTGGVYAVVQQGLNSASLTPVGPRTVEYFDALNRSFRNETEGFDGTRVFIDTEFNERGETVAITRPYFEGTAGIDIQTIISTYDAIGRTLTVTQPDGGLTRSDYNGLSTTSTNALGQIEIRTTNAIGELIKATDNLGGTVAHTYGPFGNIEETNANGVISTMTYDIRGRKASMNDPNMGQWFYNHNVLGELISQTNAENQTVTFEYDTLGRMTRRVENEGLTEWTYDTAAKGIGKLHSVTAPEGYLQTQSYDSLGRSSATTTTIDGVNYSSSVTYDGAGRVETQVYPSGFAVRNAYNARGYLVSVSEDGGATVYWQAGNVNAEGQVTQETLGNGVVTARAYDPKTSLLDSITTTLGPTRIQDLAYNFDKLGNLRRRADLRQDRQEDFLYDGLNRLTTTTLTDSGAGGGILATTAYTYDSFGNIQTKSDVGSYLYGGAGAGPHAVTEVAGEVYAYDLNGNLTSGGGREITYASFNKPVLIRETATGDEAGFTYGPDRARIKQRIVENGVARDVVYIGSYEHRTRFGSPDELVHYISAGGTVAIHTVYDDNLPATNKARYLHRDHLGSVDSITGETGAVVERLSFDAHGKRRLADWTAGEPAAADAETPRGFTGHEHLDSVGLIHMNGRVYDPALGRFVSADPNVQAPNNTQSFNRYSYVKNNPLSYTDPSGFFFSKIKKLFKKAFKFSLKVARAMHDPTYQWQLSQEVLQNRYGRMAVMFAAAFVPGPWSILAVAAVAGLSTVANGGSLTQALTSAAIAGVTAAAFYGIGEAFSMPAVQALHPVKRVTAKTLAHGVVGGLSTHFQGGKFHEGFAAAGVAQLAAPVINQINIPGPQGVVVRSAVAATVGGVSARLGGGKFRNGAITAAFGRLFNDEAHMAMERSRNADRDLFTLKGRAGGYVAAGGKLWKMIQGAFDVDLGSIEWDATHEMGFVRKGVIIGGDAFGWGLEVELGRTEVPFYGLSDLNSAWAAMRQTPGTWSIRPIWPSVEGSHALQVRGAGVKFGVLVGGAVGFDPVLVKPAH